MNILFTCGGTAGHINPAVALARMFRERDGANILFVGADGGMETRLVPKEGFALKTVTITNFRRSLKPSAIGHNLKTVANMAKRPLLLLRCRFLLFLAAILWPPGHLFISAPLGFFLSYH